MAAGFIKTDGENVVLVSDLLWISDRGEMLHRQFARFMAMQSEEWMKDHPDFEIIPRNPETYKDWQVGDVVVGEDGCDLKVEARLYNAVFLSFKANGNIFAFDSYYTCDEMHRCGYRLVLTDYEKELANAKNAPKFLFKKEDKVLWKDDMGKWEFGIFKKFNSKEILPYTVITFRACVSFKCSECIPYNEKTWRLLGTTDNYEEE